MLLLSYLVLPVRGALAAMLMSEAGVWPVQVLAQHFGCSTAFVVPDAVSTGSLVLWLGHARSLSGVCGKPGALPTTSS